MAKYAYQAIKTSGDMVKGSVEADSIDSAAAALFNMQYTPVKIKESPSGSLGNISFGSKIKKRSVLIFTKQLQSLLKAGVPMLECLTSLEEQEEDEAFKLIISAVANDIENGASLSDALAHHPQIFSELYINSVHIGELSGTLDDILLSIAEFLNDEMKLRQKITKATRYPIFVLSALGAAFLVFIYFVIPRFQPIFEKGGKELPLPTKMILGLNTLLTVYWLPLLIIVIGAVAGFIYYYRTENGRSFVDAKLLDLPIYGKLLRKISMQRFSRTLALLNASGIPMLKALETAANVETNRSFSNEIKRILTQVENGSSIANAMKEGRYFSPLMIHMISVGEKGGSLDDMLHNISEFNHSDIEQVTENLTAMIEPVVTAILGVMVLFLALSIFLPMWNMLSFVK